MALNQLRKTTHFARWMIILFFNPKVLHINHLNSRKPRYFFTINFFRRRSTPPLPGICTHYPVPVSLLTWVINNEKTPKEGCILKQIDETKCLLPSRKMVENLNMALGRTFIFTCCSGGILNWRINFYLCQWENFHPLKIFFLINKL